MALLGYVKKDRVVHEVYGHVCALDVVLTALIVNHWGPAKCIDEHVCKRAQHAMIDECVCVECFARYAVRNESLAAH